MQYTDFFIAANILLIPGLAAITAGGLLFY
jgi:hypothetical protein